MNNKEQPMTLYKCQQNDVIIELNKDKIYISIDGETSKTVIGIKDLQEAMRLFGIGCDRALADKAIMAYDHLLKRDLPKTFEPLRDHGTHAVFCNQINDLRNEAREGIRLGGEMYDVYKQKN